MILYISMLLLVRVLAALSFILLSLGGILDSWYSLQINLGACSTCTQLLLQVGQIFEMSEIEVFVIENNISLKSGILATHICAEGQTYCINADRVIKENYRDDEKTVLLKEIMDDVDLSRYPYVSALVMSGVAVAIIMSLGHPGFVTDNMLAAAALSSLMTGCLAIFAILIGGRSYYKLFSVFSIRELPDENFVISIPWGLYCAIYGAFLSLFNGYQIWKCHNGIRKAKLRNWLYKVDMLT